jgi:hypothetical protein
MRKHSRWVERTKTLLLLLVGGPAAPAAAPADMGGGGMPYDPDAPLPRLYCWSSYGAEGLAGHATVRRFRGGSDLDEDGELLLLLTAFFLR